jgi:hypothetical protein
MKVPGWTTPADLRGQVLRYWESGRMLAAPLKGESLFPLELRLRGPDTRALSERFDEVRQWIRELEGGRGYEIEWAEVNHRQLGRNRIPARIVVPGEAEALDLIGKSGDAQRFRSLAERTLHVLPELAAWLARRPLTALASAAEWERVLAVLLWFRAHPGSGRYLRQLDIEGVARNSSRRESRCSSDCWMWCWRAKLWTRGSGTSKPATASPPRRRRSASAFSTSAWRSRASPTWR